MSVERMGNKQMVVLVYLQIIVHIQTIIDLENSHFVQLITYIVDSIVGLPIFEMNQCAGI